MQCKMRCKRESRTCKKTLTKLREVKEELPEFQLVLRDLNMKQVKETKLDHITRSY